MIDLERLLRVPYVDPENGYDISFDGERAAFSWNLSWQWEIYEVNLRGARDRLTAPGGVPAARAPRLVSSGPGAKTAPLYSPDGTRLVYGVDTDDVAAGAQYMVRAGLADSKHIALTGRSHGGYLTMTCMTRYPELWAAGSAVVPFLNWFTAHANARADLQHWDIENLGDPVENHDLWHERSPFFFLDRVRAPVQLICGANDPRCPACESVQARDKLQTLGKEVELVLYHDEGHGFLKIENVINAEVRRLAFLARALEEKCVASNSGG